MISADTTSRRRPPSSVFGAANRLQTARAPRAGDPRAVGLQSRVDRGVRTRGLLATRAVSASPAPEGGVCGPSLMQSHFYQYRMCLVGHNAAAPLPVVFGAAKLYSAGTPLALLGTTL